MTTNKENLWSKIPNRFFYSIEEGTDSILKQTKFKDKTLLILDYLYMQMNRRKIIKFTLENMIIECGFICSTKKGETNFQFKEILSILHKIKVIEYEGDFEKVSPKELIVCSLTLDLSNKYTELYDAEKEKIHNQEIEKVDNLKLLMYYCYLKCRMYKRPKGDELVKSGGRSEVAYPPFKKITEDLGLTDDTIDKYNKILVALDMIRYKSAGTWYYKSDPNKIVRESVNFYTLFTDEETAQHNLKEGIKFYKKMDRNSNKVFTGSKNYKNNNKILNGELGSIIKKEKRGTATAEDIIRKNQIIFSITANEEQHGIQALLDSNPNTLLSDIYSGFNSEKKADKYYDLEESLGLLDTGKEFGVDFKYYKWIMMNYDKEEHDKFMHCVNNKKKAGLKTEDIIYFADKTSKHKGFGLQNDKKVIKEDIIVEETYVSEKDDSAFIEEMGWEPEADYMDWTDDDEDC